VIIQSTPLLKNPGYGPNNATWHIITNFTSGLVFYMLSHTSVLCSDSDVNVR